VLELANAVNGSTPLGARAERRDCDIQASMTRISAADPFVTVILTFPPPFL
jgi:hypothetical protein